MGKGKLNFEPWGQNILIEQDALPEQKKGEIILAERERPETGTVIAVGPGRKHGNGFREPMRIEVGWKVMYPVHAARAIKLGDKEYHLIDENGIFGIFTG